MGQQKRGQRIMADLCPLFLFFFIWDAIFEVYASFSAFTRSIIFWARSAGTSS